MTTHTPVQWPAVPKVTVSERGVTCEDCRKTFRMSGTHFARIHHIPRQRNRVALLRLFGLPLGSRLCDAQYRETMRDIHQALGGPSTAARVALAAARPFAPRVHWKEQGLSLSAASHARVSAAARESQSRATAANQLRGRAVMTCAHCGFTLCFPRRWATMRPFCGSACYQAARKVA